ncbi:Coenzyme F420 hydrogenase/dehydrogenase, beta subunit C-terminal domain [Synergistaceae bacterium OttesenSCG-928-I11]|nr:Coenzyme F420 hydrogenase/dehydrogenase, beta subunit C-terminal domain [Synergistaceae bacterium OttesenSCG-928-I11]
MQSVYDEKNRCSGCGACKAACPCGAIGMKPDDEGFRYPAIDRAACIDCGACRAVCPYRSDDFCKEAGEPVFYAARHKDPDVLAASTSGGAFTAVSDFFLEHGGVVYGADFDDAFDVVHRRAETASARDRFRVSKYVQSRTDEAYADAVRDLHAGRTVPFTGTPCQTAGIRALARHENLSGDLHTCDLICHSIPSPAIWTAYKRLVEEEQGGRLTDLVFRSKELAWNRRNTYRTFRFRTTASDDWVYDKRFYVLFFKYGCIARRSCYACPFADTRRASDVTIADYWGIEKYLPEFRDPLGISLVTINSPKGAALLDFLGREMEMRRRPACEQLAEQPRLSGPEPLPPYMDAFWEDFRREGLSYVLAKKYGDGMR